MTIEERLFENNTICIFGRIDEEVVARITKQVLALEYKFRENNVANPTIIVLINSCGGSASGALAIYDMLRATNCFIATVCVGLSESVASIILSGGTNGLRYALKNSEILIKQHVCNAQGELDGTISKERLVKTKKKLNEILAENAWRDIKEVEFDAECNYYLSPEEAKGFGIIDKVINDFSIMYDDIPCEVTKIDLSPTEIESGDCSYDYDNDENAIALMQERLEKKKKEIITRLKNEISSSEEIETSIESDIITEEVENAIDVMSTLYPNELDLIEASIGNGYISERWIKRYAYCGDVPPVTFIEHFLKLGIVEKVSTNIYKYTFSLETFKLARKKL